METDIRFSEPLYTAQEASRYLDVRTSSLRYWAYGRDATPPVIHAVATDHRFAAALPFLGLAEALIVNAFRKAGLSLQKIRLAREVLQDKGGIEYALASKRLLTSGKDVLWDYAQQPGERELANLFTGNRVFAPVVEHYLELVSYGADGFAERLRLPITPHPVVDVHPKRAYGQPLFIRGGASMEAVMDRFGAGDPIELLEKDFGVAPEDVIEIARVYIRWERQGH